MVNRDQIPENIGVCLINRQKIQLGINKKHELGENIFIVLYRQKDQCYSNYQGAKRRYKIRWHVKRPICPCKDQVNSKLILMVGN